MNAEIYQISADQFERLLPEVNDREVVMFAAKRSAEILVGMFNSEPLCFIGVAPTTLISDTAYVWMIETEEGRKRSRLIARYSKGMVETILLKYIKLHGHCFNPKSAAWLKWLGAEFTSETEFEIRRG
jgi:hypothetical protein